MIPEILTQTHDVVGESPVFDPVLSRLYWVDIVGKALRWRGPDESVNSLPLPDFPTAVALTDRGRLLLSLASGLVLLDPAEGRPLPLAAPEKDDGLMRLNEGKCDPRGRFWSASMETNLTPEGKPRIPAGRIGRLYRVEGREVTPMGERMLGIPNTMAWSPDRRRFYFGDSARNLLWVHDYDEADGTIGNRRVFVEGGPGVPDGSAIDTEGCLWTARFGAGCVIRYTPEGGVDRVVELPARNPTACGFGGSRLDELYITTATFGLSAADCARNPAEGALIRLRPGIGGLPETAFREPD